MSSNSSLHQAGSSKTWRVQDLCGSMYYNALRMRLREKLLMAVGLGSLGWILWLLLVDKVLKNPASIRSLSPYTVSEGDTSTKPIHILSWTGYSMGKDDNDEAWWGTNDNPNLDRCYDERYLPPSMRCIYTNDKSRYNDSDVVLFRGRKLETIPLPHFRTAKQKWVFWEFEPPYKVWQYTNLTKYNGVFNLTSTYTRDSDIANPHDLNKMCIVNQAKYRTLEKVDFAQKKGKVPVVWLASICKSHSKRETYVNQMQKYIQVDIYGGCGNLTCGTNDLTKWKETKCEEKLFNKDNGYKFYLAFENSLCDDYVTEKLSKVEGYNVIPVVMGKVDYAKIMPTDSYIDVRDFRGPKELAKYLDHLDKNDELFNQMLRTKKSLHCDLLYKYLPWPCIMCQRLHELRDRRRIVYDLAKFWGSRRCVSQEDLLNTGSQPDWEFNIA